MADPFSYKQAQEIARAFGRHGVRYLFIGKSGAIILGFPDTTQDVDLFAAKSPENGRAIVAALKELGFPLTPEQAGEIVRGKDFVQLRTGPFDLDLVFAPDGIESFEEAEARAVQVEGMPVCHIDDIIRSKQEAGRVKDREALPRLRAFRDWWVERRRSKTPRSRS
jgi:predicted nucleotidyltransferase